MQEKVKTKRTNPSEILTKKFLEKEYIKNKKSISQIQNQTGIYWSTIKNYLKQNNFNLRNHKEQASISSPGGKFKYKNFLTKEFLEKEYLQNKKGIINLSRELNIDRTIVSRYLKINKIPKRSSKDQFHINFPPKRFKLTFQIISFIEGLLLGDASIPKRKDGLSPRTLTQSCKHLEYLTYIKERFNFMGVESSPILSRWIKDERCKEKRYFQSFFQTKRYKDFEGFRKKWYPFGKKVIPKDIVISKDFLLQVYLSDGNFYREICFCLDCFSKQNLLFLKSLIDEELNINSKVRKSGKGFHLIINKSEAHKFFNYIGNSPVKCYEYKWKDNESEDQKIRKRLKARERYKIKRLIK